MISLTNKTALVTGATSGIGKVTARELARMGARVFVHGRNPAKVAATVAEISSGIPGKVEGVIADFASLEAVRRLASEVKSRTDRLDILVNNAGGATAGRTLTADGLERTFAVNHLAPFLLTNLLHELIKGSRPARIVNVASEAHRIGTIDFDDLQGARRYRTFQAYGQTKRENILFTFALARRLEGSGVSVTAMHPGAVNTGIWDSAKGPARVILRVLQWFMISAERGAAPVIRLASAADVEGVTGAYFDRFKRRDPHPATLDVAAQERLWIESARLAGI